MVAVVTFHVLIDRLFDCRASLLPVGSQSETAKIFVRVLGTGARASICVHLILSSVFFDDPCLALDYLQVRFLLMLHRDRSTQRLGVTHCVSA